MLIINKMYAGGYLFADDNIGHEIINLIKANDGKYKSGFFFYGTC